jgi:thiol-disulfide isomerase/thioredoxin
MPRITHVCLLLLILSSGCRRAMPEQSAWNGTLELAEGVALPFRMELDLSAEKPGGHFLVGDEKTPIPEISRDGDSLVLTFSEYGAEMRGVWDGGQWVGNYLRHRSDGTTSFEFAAAPASASDAGEGQASRFAPPAGNYQVDFADLEAAEDTTVAKFWTEDDELFGTFIAPDGDYGLLAGQATPAGVQFNRFTGWQAIAIAIEGRDNAWSGTYYAAHNLQPRAFTLHARPDLNPELPSKLLTSMKNADAEFAFSGVSLSGEMARNTDERFEGKALVVDIMGTWCHNCLDAAPVLQQLQDQYGKNGLEVIGLAFEISDDVEVGRKNLQLYKDRFGLTYTLLFCGSLDDANVEKQLHSQMANFFAYPTTLFIDRQRKVRAIHSGFKGPGTGEEFQAQVRQFQEAARKLIE